MQGVLEITSKLQGDFGELAFEHYCIKNKYAYISLEEIYKTLTPKNVLYFRFGYHRIPITLPEKMIEEVRTFCKPTNEKEHEPSFVFDYLTCVLNYRFEFKDDKYVQKQNVTPYSFNWVEIKTGQSELTKNQKEYSKKSNISFRVFRVLSEWPKMMHIADESHS